MRTFKITFIYEGGDTEDMHHDALHRLDAWYWAATEGITQTRYYSGLVRKIIVDAA